MVLPGVGFDIILLLLLAIVLFLWKPASLDWLWSRENRDPESDNIVSAALPPASRLRIVYERLLEWLRRLVPIYYILWWIIITVQANFDQTRRPPDTGPWSGTLFAVIVGAIGIVAWVLFGWDQSGRAGRLKERMRAVMRRRSSAFAQSEPRLPRVEAPTDISHPKRKRKSRFKRQL